MSSCRSRLGISNAISASAHSRLLKNSRLLSLSCSSILLPFIQTDRFFVTDDGRQLSVVALRIVVGLTLGIDTSGRAGSIALVEDGEVLLETELSATGRRHARTLVPEIKAALDSLNLSASDVTTVAVSIGPGSFTGLRVGVVCGKTFAYATGCSLVGVDTFQAVAAASNIDETGPELWVIDDALRGDVFAGRYAYRDEQWQILDKPHLVSLEQWKQRVGEVCVAGPAVPKLKAELDGLQLRSGDNLPQASDVAKLGAMRALANELDDPFELKPFYIRRSAAEEKADGMKTS